MNRVTVEARNRADQTGRGGQQADGVGECRLVRHPEPNVETNIQYFGCNIVFKILLLIHIFVELQADHFERS